MRNLLDLVKFRDSVEYRPMFRTIIKFQIQALIMQLANAGEESILLTACVMDNSPEEDIVGSELGQTFLVDHQDFPAVFRYFCRKKKREKDQVNELGTKRKQPEMNWEPTTEERSSNDVNESDVKKVKVEKTSSPESGANTRDSTADVPYRSEPSFYNPGMFGAGIQSPNLMSPNLMSPVLMGQDMMNSSAMNMSPNKEQHKCSQCDYTSKFKANVMRHERSIHGINVEGAAGPTIQYACTLCTYKSLYRSNLMRHEKNVHKMEPTAPDPGDMSWLGLPTTAGNHLPTIPCVSNSQSATTGDQDKPRNGQTQTQKDSDEAENSQDSQADCQVCGFCQLAFSTMQSLKDHVEHAHYGMGGKYECGKCRTSFNNLVQFQNHMTIHYVPRQEKCVCGRTFQYRVSLLKHIPKCVIAKETNFKMSDIVLGSGLDIDTAHGRSDPGPRPSRTDIEQGIMGKSISQLGTNMQAEQGEKHQELEQVNIKQEIDEGTSGFSMQIKDNQTTELGHRQQEICFENSEMENENTWHSSPNMQQNFNRKDLHIGKDCQ